MSRIETIAEGVTLYLGDCREILRTLGGVHSVITDPVTDTATADRPETQTDPLYINDAELIRRMGVG